MGSLSSYTKGFSHGAYREYQLIAWRRSEDLYPYLSKFLFKGNVDMGWSGKTEYKKLNREIAVTEGFDFQRKITPLLRLFACQIIEAPALKSIDCSGVDHLAWSDAQPFSLLVQCKGFKIDEHEIGSSQINQCIKSINSFKKSSLRAKKYILVHNRDGRNQEFRERVEKALSELVKSGQVKEALLFDRHKLLNGSFNAMQSHFLKLLRTDSLSISKLSNKEKTPLANQLCSVPLTISHLVADANKFCSESMQEKSIADPIPILRSILKKNSIVIIGEFGFGKTSTIMRVLKSDEMLFFYIPGALIDHEVMGTKDFLFRCVNIDMLLEGFDENEQITAEKIARPVIERAFKDRDLPIALIMDGLDESTFLARRGGLLHLFNILREVLVPVIISVRTEFWKSCQVEFSSSFGKIGRHQKATRSHIKLIELNEWSKEEIYEFIRLGINSAVSPKEKSNLIKLENLSKTSKFDYIYGDIPRRPLFLKYIIDSVAHNGIPDRNIGRAQLFLDWARDKIIRDTCAPIDAGGHGRMPIRSRYETLATTIELAWDAMSWAAAKMTRIVDESIELTNSCRLKDVLGSSDELGSIKDPIGLLLNSLLIPLNALTGINKLMIKFAHRSYQEFFLAWFEVNNQGYFSVEKMPDPVKDWMDQIRLEKLC